ncbi:glutamine amidotransferase [Kocuria dechangensis]|uniref:Glutamine amidotransferase n=1 Tax=Kocuria dechangensis TaxID=1176249 RepID=A0A917H227_9MICC|nr:glutamine amidotransferase [Kocuria dechangensis]GGG65453.1 glutamine amidotransferase [Kocuria dechangensis]
MKPFLLLATRAENDVADEEYETICRFSGLEESRLHRVRLELAPMPPIDLERYSGVIIGGSPFNSSDPPELKTEVQRRAETEMRDLLDEVVARDFPFLGACYGVGTLGTHQGGVVDRTFGEDIGVIEVALTEEGRRDPLLRELPATFHGFVGHKEGTRRLAPTAVLLASGAACPVQMFRVKQNLYATQFHPELDGPALLNRIEAYKSHGYFPPGDAERVKDRIRTGPRVTEPEKILAAFVDRYAR